MNLIVLATDGSSLIAGKHKKIYESSSACSIYINGSHACDLGVYHKGGTNSLGELYAIILGLDRLKEIILDHPELKDSQIIVLSDSEYVMKSLNSYIYSWVKQGLYKKWLNSKKEEVAYQSLFKYIWKTYHPLHGNGYELNKCKIQFWHMRGHINEKVNKKVAYDKFVKTNRQISFEHFEKFISYNHHVDELANQIRLRQDIYYEKAGDSEWVKNAKKMQTRDGRIVILPRSKRKS